MIPAIVAIAALYVIALTAFGLELADPAAARRRDDEHAAQMSRALDMRRAASRRRALRHAR